MAMRYIVIFKNKDIKAKILSQKEGEAAVQAKAKGQNIRLRGAVYDQFGIDQIKPFNKDNIDDWYVTPEIIETQQRKELANKEEREYLEATNSLPQLTNGQS